MIYQGNFDDEDDVFNEFAVPEDEREDVNILYARYVYENYEGDAYVLFAKNGYLYEVFGGHCSCYGLEGQWEPEKVDDLNVFVQALMLRGYKDVIPVVRKYMGGEC